MSRNKDILHAVFDNDLERVKELVGTQDLSRVQAKGYVFLRVACKDNFTEIAEYLLSMNCNVNSKNSELKPSKTPLHYAASRGSVKVVVMLLYRGARVDALDEYKKTPLYYAVVEKHAVIVELLLGKGSRLQLTEFLHIALKYKDPCLRIVESLLNYGVPAHVRFNDENYPILLAASCGSYEIFNLLLSKGADINTKGKDGETLLHISARKGCLPIVTHLVKQAENGHHNLLSTLFKFGCDINIITKQGYTALLYAKKGANEFRSKHGTGGPQLCSYYDSSDG